MNDNIKFVGNFDILGFSNLVKTKSLDWIINTLDQEIKKNIYQATTPLVTEAGKKKKTKLANYIRFSDTILLYSDDVSLNSLYFIIEASSLLISHLLPIGIPIRGAITKGKFYFKRSCK